MTQEGKAKAYDVVLNKLRHFIAKGVDPLITRADVQDFFPELAESEDEKVIKEIIELVMQPTWKTEEEFHRRNVLCAWLENVPVTIDHEKREGFHLGYKACLEKQGEQKIEENKGNIEGISPTWSEDDDWTTTKIMNVLLGSKIFLTPEETNELVYWLKSIKGRVQPKQEWSEEDEKKRKCLIKGLEDRMGFGWASDPFSREEYIDWLKSLRPQSQWKPSELQLGCLSDAIEHYNSSGYPAPKLKELLDDLKKIKEGNV